MVAATEAVNLEAPDKALLQVVDFSGYHRYSEEPVPTAARVEMRWYLDSSHYHERLGDLVLEQLFSGLRGEDGQFGVALSSDGLDRHLGLIREARDRYRAANAGQYDKLAAIAREQLAQRQRSGEQCRYPGNLPAATTL